MKKVFIIVSAIILFFSACNNSASDNKSSTGESKGSTEDITSNPDYQKGLAVVAKSDCLTCHKVEEKLTGPAYRDVANKYAGLPDTIVTHLAHKILEGGYGVWGETPMTPHPSLTEDEAEAAVKYILLLKK